MTPYTGETPAADPITSESGEPEAGEQDVAGPELDSGHDGGATVPDDSPEDSGGEKGIADEPDTGDSTGGPVAGGLEDAA